MKTKKENNELERIESREEFIDKVKTEMNEEDIIKFSDNNSFSKRISFSEDEINEIVKENRNNILPKRVCNSKKYITYEISPEDALIVKILKELINEKGITLQDIYNSNLFKDANQAYNFYSSMMKHHYITEERIKIWCYILNIDMFITVVKK